MPAASAAAAFTHHHTHQVDTHTRVLWAGQKGPVCRQEVSKQQIDHQRWLTGLAAASEITSVSTLSLLYIHINTG